MANIFLSYARADRPRAGEVAEFLERNGHSVWWDTSLIAGSVFSAEIARRIESADHLVVLWSNYSIESHFVLDEAERGRKRGKLVPARIDDCQLPIGFGGIHTIDVAAGAEGCATLLRALGGPAKPVPVPQPLAATIPPSPKAAGDIHKQQELEFWSSVKASTNRREISAFLQAFPDGVFAGLAREKLKTIHWDSVSNSSLIPALENFIDTYPDSARSVQARARIAELAAAQEHEAWSKITSNASADDLDQFAASYPASPNAAEARASAGAMRKETHAWDAALNSTDPSLTATYLTEFPHGRFVTEAKQRRKELARTRDATDAGGRNFVSVPRWIPSNALSKILAVGGVTALAAYSTTYGSINHQPLHSGGTLWFPGAPGPIVFLSTGRLMMACTLAAVLTVFGRLSVIRGILASIALYAGMVAAGVFNMFVAPMMSIITFQYYSNYAAVSVYSGFLLTSSIIVYGVCALFSRRLFAASWWLWLIVIGIAVFDWVVLLNRPYNMLALLPPVHLAALAMLITYGLLRDAPAQSGA